MFLTYDSISCAIFYHSTRCFRYLLPTSDGVGYELERNQPSGWELPSLPFKHLKWQENTKNCQTTLKRLKTLTTSLHGQPHWLTTTTKNPYPYIFGICSNRLKQGSKFDCSSFWSRFSITLIISYNYIFVWLFQTGELNGVIKCFGPLLEKNMNIVYTIS